MLKATAHKKLTKSLKGDTAYFNRKGTYMVTYTMCSVLGVPQIRSSYKDALKQLAEGFPEKKARIEKCQLSFNLLYRTCMDEVTEDGYASKYMGICMVYISDWEIGNAICGFNFDGSMRKKLVPVVDIADRSLSEIIQHRSGDLEPLSPEERKSASNKYIGVLNKIVDRSKDNVIVQLGQLTDRPENMEILSGLLIKICTRDSLSHEVFTYIIRGMIEKEIISLVGTTEDVITSIFHQMIIRDITAALFATRANASPDEYERKYNKNVFQFFAHLYNDGIVSNDVFEEVFVDSIHKFKATCQASCSDMTNLLHIANISSNKINKYFSGALDDLEDMLVNLGEPIHHALMENVKSIPKLEYIDDIDKHITKGFKVEDLPPLCFLPALTGCGSLHDMIESHVEKHNLECTNLQYIPIKAYQGYVKKVSGEYKHNELFSKSMPKWVKHDLIKSEMSKYNTGPDSSYPIMNIIEARDGNSKRLKFTFNPHVDCYSDASFAMRMLKRFEMRNGPDVYTTVTFSFSYI